MHPLKVETRVRTPLDYKGNRRSGGVYLDVRVARPLDVPHTCRSVQSAREFAVGAIEPSSDLLSSGPS